MEMFKLTFRSLPLLCLIPVAFLGFGGNQDGILQRQGFDFLCHSLAGSGVTSPALLAAMQAEMALCVT